jgi:photosystem II stability/assembly factor-like uncharacterized protein
MKTNRGGIKERGNRMKRGKKEQVRVEVKVKPRVDRVKGIDPSISRLKKWVIGLFGFCLAVLCCINAYADNKTVWRKSDYGLDEVKIKSVCMVKERPETVFAGGQRCIYKSTDTGNTWERIFMLTGERRGINFIAYNPQNTSIMYAATSDGLYISFNAGNSWKRYFRGSDDTQRNTKRIAISSDGNIIFIGTDRGLFRSNNSGKDWSSEHYFINKSIRSLATGEGFYYACADDGVYCQKEGNGHWDRVYNLIKYEEEVDDAEYADNDYEPEKTFISLNSIIISKGIVYIATDEGVLSSSIGSGDFSRINTEGLKSGKINFILKEDDDMFITSDRGVFKYDINNDIWMDYSIGLATFEINMIDGCFDRGIVFAAAEKGLFRMALNNNIDNTGKNWVSDLCLREPSIEDIHRAAIAYAEVSPDKIKWMRNAAKTQALIPKVTFGIDGDVSKKIDLDRGGTNDPDFYIEGPRDKKWGWDIGLTWNLGELIWSYHQTSIDVRSRLMVQLRNDILDEVTKLYFERLRLKGELMQSPLQDTKQISLKQLRLAELTANIDALTGGYLSSSIRKDQAGVEKVRF